jgi:hypothetical protein
MHVVVNKQFVSLGTAVGDRRCYVNVGSYAEMVSNLPWAGQQ